MKSEGNKQRMVQVCFLPNWRHGKWDVLKISRLVCFHPSCSYVFHLPYTHTNVNTQARPLGGPSELGGVGTPPNHRVWISVNLISHRPWPWTSQNGQHTNESPGLQASKSDSGTVFMGFKPHHTRPQRMGSLTLNSDFIIERKGNRLLGRVFAGRIGSYSNYGGYRTDVMLMA